MTTRYVALLRGINVGGNNLIKMSALKACLEALGMLNVSTYIASGNVLFDAPRASGAETGAKRERSDRGHEARLARALETGLSKAFGYEARLTLRSPEEMQALVKKAPKGFGKDAAKYRYDCIFLFEPLTAKEALPLVPQKEGVDQLWAGDRVLYSARLIAKVTSSRLNRIVGTKAYQSMTIRNWNTSSKLAALLAK
ncbi:MAG: DUF1697 domain-containing protein [Myxococcaceae bacterium]|nr:DUF1697 domain-containing protein [Myxococcaceae bacterium]